MIGYLYGEVLFSDGNELILKTASGVGYQMLFNDLLVEGSRADVYVSHIVKEASEDLFAFKNIRDKKMFEQLITVKGVGPKSAFSLVMNLGTETIVQAVQFDNKKSLTRAPGIGAKAAAQICLDLGGKVQKIFMYSDQNHQGNFLNETNLDLPLGHSPEVTSAPKNRGVIDDTVMACKELGFKEESVMPLIHKVLENNDIQKAEQLIHLVLKEV